MAKRKLGRKTGARISILRNLTSDLIVYGSIETTIARGKEVQAIADRLIAEAVQEVDNYSTREVLKSQAKVDSSGKKLLKEATAKSGATFHKVERELSTVDQTVDAPSRLAARRRAMNWLVKSKTVDGEAVQPVNHLYNNLAPQYRERTGGYTRLIRLGNRRGDGAEICVVELV